MIDHFLQFRQAHVVAALASGLLFFVRAIAVHAGARWPMTAPVRFASYGIDSVLLAAALMLVTITRQYPFGSTWLTVKLVLVVVYIVLGSFALKRGRTRGIRVACTAGALLVFAAIVAIARNRGLIG